MISDKLLPLFHMCIRGLISHAGGSRDYGASGGVRHVYHCFTEISVKCTNSKCSPCKCTWLLGSCGNCVEASDSDISWSLCKDTLRSTVPWPPCLQSATGVFGSCWWTPGGAARDPREPWELCDCDSILSIWWLCQGTPVDTVGFRELQTSEGDALRSEHLPQALFVH